MKKYKDKPMVYYTHRTLEEALRNKYDPNMSDEDFNKLYNEYLAKDIVISEKYNAIITKNGTFYGNILCDRIYNPYEYLFSDECYKDFIDFAGYECFIGKSLNTYDYLPRYKVYGLYYKDDIYYSYIEDCKNELKTKKLK